MPEIAAEFGLHVTLGVWLNEREPQNEREIESAIALAKQLPNIDSVIVGNENDVPREKLHAGDPKYDADHTVKELIAKIQRVKREVAVPVTTAEVWNVWLDHPELASSVDYLAVHILPYWEGIPGSRAVDHALNGVRAAAPGLSGKTHRHRRVRLAERGAQSQGRGAEPAHPGRGRARFRRPRRRHGHRLFDRRGVRSAVEDE